MNNSNQPITEKSIEERVKNDNCFKVLLFNIIGFAIGIIATTASYYILKFLLIDVLGKVSFITKFISWPCDYEYYALCTMIIFSVGAGISTCTYFCNLVKTKYNFGVLILGILGALNYLLKMILYFNVNGFHFIMLIVYIIGIAVYLFFSLENFKNTYKFKE